MMTRKQLTMNKLDTICRLIAAVAAEVDEFAPDIPDAERKTLKSWLVSNLMHTIWTGYCSNSGESNLAFKRKIAETLRDEIHAELMVSRPQDTFDEIIRRVFQKQIMFWHENQSKEAV